MHEKRKLKIYIYKKQQKNFTHIDMLKNTQKILHSYNQQNIHVKKILLTLYEYTWMQF